MLLTRPDHAAPAAAVAAVAAQTHPVVRTVVACRGGNRRVLSEALAGGATWVWVIDIGVVPAPSALERLLDPLAAPSDLPPPMLLAGRVVGPDNRLDPASAPWPRLTRKDVAVVACRHRLLSIRATRHGSLLVHRRAIERHGLGVGGPRTADDGFEWTARILKHEPGYLVPRSFALRHDRRAGAGGRTRGDLAGRLQTLRGNALEGEERLLFAQLLAQNALGRLGRLHRPRRGADPRAASTPLEAPAPARREGP